MPIPADNPCPKLPVATFSQGIRGVGWPSSDELNVRNFDKSWNGTIPASVYAAHKIGAAWPLLNTNSSLARSCGLFTLYFISLKNKQAISSAELKQVVG